MQTLYSESPAGAPGTVRYAKRTGTTVFLVGHLAHSPRLASCCILRIVDLCVS